MCIHLFGLISQSLNEHRKDHDVQMLVVVDSHHQLPVNLKTETISFKG